LLRKAVAKPSSGFLIESVYWFNLKAFCKIVVTGFLDSIWDSSETPVKKGGSLGTSEWKSSNGYFIYINKYFKYKYLLLILKNS
jgi:hypothetical protein